MGKTIQKNTYKTCVADIEALYEKAQAAVVKTYWQIGRRIVEEEQHGRGRAEYGTQLLSRLSVDLTRKYGKGFSATNLQRMRQLYLDNRKYSTSNKLTWSQHVELMSFKDIAMRKRMTARAVRENISAREIREIAKNAPCGVPPQKGHVSEVPLQASPGVLHVYRLISQTSDNATVDCGFHVKRILPVKKLAACGVQFTETPTYTYPARIVSIVDGDTIRADVDIGYDTVIMQIFRLRGINAPERSTPEGVAAKHFVSSVLTVGDCIVLRTHATDMYGRYVADVWYTRNDVPRKKQIGTHEETNYSRICSDRVYLNQELLDRGFAKKYE